MDPNVLVAIIGGATGFGGAIIGDFIAARATNKSTKQANTHAQQMQQPNAVAAIIKKAAGAANAAAN